jgi:predicted dehydrogenase
MADVLRWGILGTGNIARQFCAGLKTAHRGHVAAVASRTIDAANQFAANLGVRYAFGSYQELISSDEIDAVYISLPNSMHHEWTLAALAAGKDVLCEKPIAVNSRQAEEMFDAAERAGRVLVEAFMYRSHPQTLAVLEAVERGEIGQVKLIRTSFCYRTQKIAGNIRFAPELAGGALMDVGCYCIDFSRLFAKQEPAEIFATGVRHASGVDEMAAGMLRFPGGTIANFSCGMGVQADNTALICGSEGFIEIPVPWKPAMRQAVWHLARGTPPRMDSVGKAPVAAPPPRQTFAVNAPGELYALEADDLAAAVFDGRPPRISRADSLGTMRVLEQMREMI